MVSKILIGDGTNSDLTPANLAALAAGDLAFVNQRNQILVAGDTITDADIIRVVQCKVPGDYKFSLPIVGKGIKEAVVKAYTDPAAHTQTITVDNIKNSSAYKLTVMFNDSHQLRDNKDSRTSLYYTSDATATATEIATAFVAKINASKYLAPLVSASNTAGVITLVAKPVPVQGLDKFGYLTFDTSMVVFDSLVPSLGAGGEPLKAATVATTVQGTKGSGTSQQVLDMERNLAGWIGYHNFTQFPVDSFPTYVVKGATYDLITISHDSNWVTGLDRGIHYPKETIIAVPTGSTQRTYLDTILTPYLASAGITFP